jgi:hypothetical protein
MSSRNLGVVALGRFLVVERYRETCLSSPASHLRGPGPDRTGGHADKPDSRSGSRAPGQPRRVG